MNVTDWLAEISPYAVDDMMQSGVLASITMAQGTLESAHGNHAPGFNFFGIKSQDNTGQLLWTQEYVKGKWIQVQAWFRVYTDLEGCIADHSNFLTVNSRYANAGFFKACANLDYRAAAQALHTAGYATDPSYADSLIRIIEDNKLYSLDKEAYMANQAIVDLQKRVGVLEVQLVKIPMPKWFSDEFGADALQGIVKDLLHVPSFWEDVAMTLRLRK